MDATFLQPPQETTPGSTGISIRGDRRQPEKKTANLVTEAHHLATSTARDTDRRIKCSRRKEVQRKPALIFASLVRHHQQQASQVADVALRSASGHAITGYLRNSSKIPVRSTEEDMTPPHTPNFTVTPSSELVSSEKKTASSSSGQKKALNLCSQQNHPGERKEATL